MLIGADGQVETQRWWDLAYTPALRGSEEELHEEFGRIFGEAVRLRMIADVPLGAFLSGGVDSSAVVWAMSRVSDLPVRTFSIGFEEEAYDETGWARQVAGLCGTKHQEFTVRTDALGLLPRLIEHYEEPYADSSALPTWYLCELTRQHVTVALNGDGGDENFAGYRRHRYWRTAQYLPGGKWFPGAELLANMLAGLGRPAPAGLARQLNGIAVGLHNLAQSRTGRYPDMWAYFPEHLKSKLLTPEFREQSGAQKSYHRLVEWLEKDPAQPAINRVLETDVHTYLPDDLLVKVDIASMAHGLECRSPLLDQELMEFAARLPASMKAGMGSGKLFLRSWLRGKIPDEILDRRKKGFGVPLDAWFRGELRQLAEEILLDRRALGRGWFRPTAVHSILKDHTTGRREHGKRIWALIALELWARQFIDA
jgi:asparagine synthase (glutamine-hydrolysing)